MPSRLPVDQVEPSSGYWCKCSGCVTFFFARSKRAPEAQRYQVYTITLPALKFRSYAAAKRPATGVYYWRIIITTKRRPGPTGHVEPMLNVKGFWPSLPQCCAALRAASRRHFYTYESILLRDNFVPFNFLVRVLLSDSIITGPINHSSCNRTPEYRRKDTACSCRRV